MGSELWFAGDSSVVISEVWRTDGTQAGTQGVFETERLAQDPEFTQIGSAVYFVAPKGEVNDSTDQVWRSDGTSQGTLRVSNLLPRGSVGAEPAELTALQGSLYFFANLPAGGRALWRYDGTVPEPVRVRDFATTQASFDPVSRFGLITLGNRLVFVADDGLHGLEPWSSDGKPGGTVLLRDVISGPAPSGIDGFTAAGGLLYFAAHDGAHGFELWRTDGTPEGTRLVQDLAPEGASSYPANFAAGADRLYFSADDGLTGHELWMLPLSGPACQPSTTALCLGGDRFRVEAFWRTPGDFVNPGDSGAGRAVPLSADTGRPLHRARL